MKKLFILLFYLSLTTPLIAQYELNIEIDKIRWDVKNIPQTDNLKKEKLPGIKNYIYDNPIPEYQFVVVPRIENANWEESPQIAPYFKKYLNEIEEYTKIRDTFYKISYELKTKGKFLITDNYEQELIKNIIDTYQDSKEKKNLYKDFEKGKVSKKLLPEVEQYYLYSTKKIKQSESYLKELKKDPINYIKSRFNKNVDFAKITYYDTVPNPYLNDIAYNKTGLGFYWKVLDKRLIDDWSWVYDEEGEYVTEDYPHKISYYRFNSHPEIRLIGKGYTSLSKFDQKDINLAFDKNGRLIRVLKTGDQAPLGTFYQILDRHNERKIGRQIALMAYADNKYDIKSKPKKVQDYITDQLGLREKTVAENAKTDKATTAMANAIINHSTADSKYGKNSKKSEQAKNKAAENFMGALFEGSADYYSPEGSAWFAQIERDNTPYFKNIYDLKRIDDTSFKGIIVDENLNPLYEIKFEYSDGEKPYRIKETVTVNKIEGTLKETKLIFSPFESKNKIKFDNSKESEIIEDIIVEDEIIQGPETPPEFPGGNIELNKWINQNLQYPENARNQRIEGRVLVRFIVEKNGSLSNISIIRGLSEDLNNEAIRLVKNMPKWIPGKNDRLNVRSPYSLPITFKID